jgi:hypothetical protein
MIASVPVFDLDFNAKALKLAIETPTENRVDMKR